MEGMTALAPNYRTFVSRELGPWSDAFICGLTNPTDFIVFSCIPCPFCNSVVLLDSHLELSFRFSSTVLQHCFLIRKCVPERKIACWTFLATKNATRDNTWSSLVFLDASKFRIGYERATSSFYGWCHLSSGLFARDNGGSQGERNTMTSSRTCR